MQVCEITIEKNNCSNNADVWGLEQYSAWQETLGSNLIIKSGNVKIKKEMLDSVVKSIVWNAILAVPSELGTSTVLSLFVTSNLCVSRNC